MAWFWKKKTPSPISPAAQPPAPASVTAPPPAPAPAAPAPAADPKVEQERLKLEREQRQWEREEHRRQAQKAEQAQQRQDRQARASQRRAARQQRRQERQQRWARRGRQAQALATRALTPPHSHSATVADGLKTSFAVLVGGACPFAIALILTISAGYYFAGLRGLSAETESVIAYGSAAIIEAVNLALFFVSSKAFWAGKRAHFVGALGCGLLLSVVSAIAQVLYLSTHVNLASVQTGAETLAVVPLLGALSSTAAIILVRAIALHIGEFACCYVIARSSVSHRKVIQQQQEEAEASQAMLTSQQFLEFQRAIHQANMAAMQRMIAALTPAQPLPLSDPLKLPAVPTPEGQAQALLDLAPANGHQTVRLPFRRTDDPAADEEPGT